MQSKSWCCQLNTRATRKLEFCPYGKRVSLECLYEGCPPCYNVISAHLTISQNLHLNLLIYMDAICLCLYLSYPLLSLTHVTPLPPWPTATQQDRATGSAAPGVAAAGSRGDTIGMAAQQGRRSLAAGVAGGGHWPTAP